MGEKKSSNAVIIVVIVGIVLLVGFTTIFNIFLSPGCSGHTVEMEEYSANEWGIFRQSYASTNDTYLAGPRPGIVLMPEVVRQVSCKPVIYFHGDGLMDLSIDVEMSAREIVTIPQANISDGKLRWDIELAGEIYDDNTSAKVVDEEGVVHDFLFYEGIDEYFQNVLVNITDQGDGFNISLQNIGEYDISDAYLIIETEGEGEPLLQTFHFPTLEKMEILNDSVSAEEAIDNSGLRSILKGDLLERGLLDHEAEELLGYWIDKEMDDNGIQAETSLTEAKGYANAQLVFFISQEEYNEMLPISFSQDPVSINRVGILHISDILVTFE